MPKIYKTLTDISWSLSSFQHEALDLSIWSFQVHDRNPLCGINYPCGKYATYTNTCQPVTDTSINGSYDVNANESGSGLMNNIATTTASSLIMENVTEAPPMLPRGFLICNQPNTFLWSLILAFGTFAIALGLRKLRRGKFLGKLVN